MVDFGLVRFLNFVQAFYKLMKRAKGQLLSKEEVLERLHICRGCEFFKNHHCTHCGCNCNSNDRSFFNKVAYPTERCPNEPPLWVEKIKGT